MASHALKQVRRPVYPTHVRVLTGLLFSAGDFARHRTTGADECTTLHAQSQHPR